MSRITAPSAQLLFRNASSGFEPQGGFEPRGVFKSGCHTSLPRLNCRFEATAALQVNLNLDSIFSAFVVGGLKFDAEFEAACETSVATKSPFGCPCYWDETGSGTTCACCNEGYCGCGESMPHMCVVCGDGNACSLGMVKTASSHRTLGVSQQMIASPSKEVQVAQACTFNATCSLSAIGKVGIAVEFPNPLKIAIGFVKSIIDEAEMLAAYNCLPNSNIVYEGITDIETVLTELESNFSSSKTWPLPFNNDTLYECKGLDF